MWNYRRFERKTLLGLRTNQPPLSGALFRLKLTKSIFVLVTASISLISGIFILFNFENYALFQRVTFEYAPDLLLQLKREQVWLITAMLSIVLGLVTFVTFFVFRMADSIAGPINLLHKRIKDLTAGKLYKSPIRVRDKDEFKELIESYNYLQKALRIQTQHELDRLKNVKTNKNDVTSQQILGDLIDQKQLQISGHVEASEPARDSRHVS